MSLVTWGARQCTIACLERGEEEEEEEQEEEEEEEGGAVWSPQHTLRMEMQELL